MLEYHFFNKKDESKLSTQKLTINQLLQKDSDGDGVMDWEEGLWGTDPNNTKTFEGIPDAEYIKTKSYLFSRGIVFCPKTNAKIIQFWIGSFHSQTNPKFPR